ncbi:MAG: hypothetical protein EAZ47_05145 [Bacteroidetes bacterium]|nr:MAG: hypothetical protein EAY72_04310 [Bacteroidota bacterium]TAF93942.1 MAG: hypothetical protein EAZ47_05145 [Bacteroidota bacterium]
MNWLNKGLLWLVLLPQSFYKTLGVHIPHLKAILRVKLMMDDRKIASWGQVQNTNKKSKPVTGATIATMIISLFLGLFYLIPFFIGTHLPTQLTIFYSFFIFMLASVLISDFTNVLIDIRDNYIILPKPVNDKTVVVARLLHILIHCHKIIIPMSLPALIYLAVQVGWQTCAAVVFTLLPVVLFTLFIINATYILVLRLTSPERFQRILGNFQIVFSIVLFGSYQIVPRLLDKTIVENYILADKFLYLLIPPYWFAQASTLLSTGNISTIAIIATLLAIAVPLICIYVVIKYLAPEFTHKLQAINSTAETAPVKNTVASIAPEAKPTAGFFARYQSMVARWVTSQGVERASFQFAWLLTARSKDFKMKVYPSIGYLAVYIFIIFFNKNRITLQDITSGNKEGQIFFITSLYMCSFLFITALNNLSYNDKWKASWIYHTTPLATPGTVIIGAAKAVIAKFYLPLVLAISTAALAIFGVKIIPSLLFGLLNELLIAAIVVRLSCVHLPFSTTQSTSVKAGSFLRGLFTMLFPVMLGLAHYWLASFWWLLLLLSAISAAGIWYMLEGIKQKNWLYLQKRSEEEDF